MDQVPLQGSPLSSQHTRNVLRIGIGLANAAWQMSQMNLAKWANDPRKIHPESMHDVFNPYDLMQVRLFEQCRQNGKTNGALRVALELWKDVRELKKAAHLLQA